MRATGGPLAVAGARVVATIAGGAATGPVAVGGRELAIRGAPGAALIGLDTATGAIAWSIAAHATEWCVIAAIDGTPDGDVVAVGSYAGWLRIGATAVASAGGSDGFAVRLDAAGNVKWLVRVGGDGADALTAVAVGASGIAVAGSITGEADFRGTPLVAHNARLATQDVAVAWLDATGLPAWGRVLGGDSDDVAAGVGILPDGGVALAATVRDVVPGAGGDNLVVRGPSDTMIATFDRTGAALGAALLGGQDYDGARGLAIAPSGEIVVGGWFSGVLRGPAGDLTADGGDDAFLARVDRTARVTSIEPITGPGREELVGLVASRANIAIGLAHTAGARAFGSSFPAPSDPTGGIAIVVVP